MKTKQYQYGFLLLLLLGINMSCKKILDIKPSISIASIATVNDAQAVLDTYNLLNYYCPGSGEGSADDYYLLSTEFNALSTEAQRRIYTWEKDNLYVAGSNDWQFAYRWVYYANSVLESLLKIDSKEAGWLHVKSQAHFWRALGFHKAVSLWAPIYNQVTASTDMGIPIRLTADFNVPTVRASVAESYQQIIEDLKQAIPYLPVTPVHVFRASKPAAYALMARTYLHMGDYTKAGLYADSCLQLKSNLIDFNTLSATANYPMGTFNAEIIMDFTIQGQSLLSNSWNKMDTTLYRSYATNDLRRTLWYKAAGTGMVAFFGSYEGNSSSFGGFATDEMYLVRAEASARTGNGSAAMSDLNALLIKRWKAGTFIPLTATSAADALAKVLTERRKELTMRDLRWMDIKRYNRDGAGITLTRIVNNKIYILPPNDPRYALPIPEDIIAITGIPQNPR